jgi:cob(I)alamin adenosyltransferase
MSITTKTGDSGETGLIGGRRVSKDSPRIESIGTIDELNAALGVMLAQDPTSQRAPLLLRIQNELFIIGAELADPEHKGLSKRLTVDEIHGLEAGIDELETKLPPLKEFVLPGGAPFAAHAHLARAICRRAERQIMRLRKTESVSMDIAIYLNRLSDLLFLLARENLFDKKIAETPWQKV